MKNRAYFSSSEEREPYIQQRNNADIEESKDG